MLHVHYGDNYGFPKCNRTGRRKCRGFTRPFRRFGPHTDLMGIAVHARTLYLTSFLGRGGKGPAVRSSPSACGAIPSSRW